MSWSDWFLPATSQTAAEQEANYARQQEEYARRVQERQQIQPDYAPTWAGQELESQDAAAWEGFQEGAAEGLKSIPGAVNSTLGATVGALFRSIPISIWLLGAVALFFYMGGAALLKGRLAKF